MATIVNSIGTTGRDFSTIQAWEDALPANLVTDGNSYVGECYNDSEFTAGVQFSGETTDSTHTITLKCASGQSFRDSGSVQSNALRYNQANGVGVSSSATYLILVNINGVSDVTVDGLQLKTTAGNSNTVVYNGGVNRLVYQNLICESASPNAITIFGADSVARNCLFINTNAGAVTAIGLRGSAVHYCTFVKPSNVTPSGTGLNTYGGGSTAVTNCAFFGYTTLNTGTPATANNNCSDLAIGFGSSNQASKTYANQFVQSDASGGVHDFKIVTGSDCVNNGSTDATNGANDIANTARPFGSTYDIGAWELVEAAGASLTVNLISNVIVNNNAIGY